MIVCGRCDCDCDCPRYGDDDEKCGDDGADERSCGCDEFWIRWSSVNKPGYASEGDYFAWSVKAHNAVNQKLGKKTLTIEEALKLWDPENKFINKKFINNMSHTLNEPSEYLLACIIA